WPGSGAPPRPPPRSHEGHRQPAHGRPLLPRRTPPVAWQHRARGAPLPRWAELRSARPKDDRLRPQDRGTLPSADARHGVARPKPQTRYVGLLTRVDGYTGPGRFGNAAYALHST